MSEGTKVWDPRVEHSRLREQVNALEGVVAKQGKQLLVAAQNFAEVTRVLKALIAQGNSSSSASLARMVETVGQQQVQIEGIALIQRISRKSAPLLTYDPMAGTPAAVSPYKLPDA